MKKLLLTLVGTALVSVAANAQYHDFSVSTGTYSEIAGITVSGSDWDDESYKIVPSYTVNAFGYAVDSFILSDYGFEFYKDGNHIGSFAPCAVDLASLGGTQSPVKWVETGSAPNRIIKIEFTNAGTYNDIDGTPSDTINYQVWFLESNNSMEVHFGKSIVVQDGDDPWDGADGPIIGAFNEEYRGILLKGDSSSPSVELVDMNTNETFSVIGMPSEGTIFIFTPRKFQVSVPIITDAPSFSAYPNPFNDRLIISTNLETVLTLTDVNGRIINTFTVNGNFELNTTQLSNGVYFLQSTSGSVMKIIK